MVIDIRLGLGLQLGSGLGLHLGLQLHVGSGLELRLGFRLVLRLGFGIVLGQRLTAETLGSYGSGIFWRVREFKNVFSRSKKSEKVRGNLFFQDVC